MSAGWAAAQNGPGGTCDEQFRLLHVKALYWQGCKFLYRSAIKRDDPDLGNMYVIVITCNPG